MNTITHNSEKVKQVKAVKVLRLPPDGNTGAGITGHGASGPRALETSSPRPGSPWLWSVHWLTFTVWGNPEELFSRLGAWFPLLRERYELGFGGHGYKSSAAFLHGVRAFWDPVSGDQRVTVFFPGAFLEGVEPARLFQFMKELKQEHRVQVSRVDLAFDGVPFTPKDVLDAFRTGFVRTVAHRDSWAWHETPSGRTVTIGSRDSTRYLRVYDGRGFTRLELEVKGTRGDAFFWLLAEEEDAPRFSLEFLRSFIDFCEPNGVNRSRWPLLDWWASFVNGVGKVRVVISAVEKTVERVRRWLTRQVSAALTFVSILDAGFLHDLLEIGEKRLSPWHRFILKGAGYA